MVAAPHLLGKHWSRYRYWQVCFDDSLVPHADGTNALVLSSFQIVESWAYRSTTVTPSVQAAVMVATVPHPTDVCLVHAKSPPGVS